MYDSPVGHAVRTTLQRIAAQGEAPSGPAWSELSERVGRAVEELRALGWSIERIIVRMKELAYEAGLPAYAPPPEVDRAAVVQRIVKLCIEQYYGH